MKKILVCILLMILTVTLCSCSYDGDTVSSEIVIDNESSVLFTETASEAAGIENDAIDEVSSADVVESVTSSERIQSVNPKSENHQTVSSKEQPVSSYEQTILPQEQIAPTQEQAPSSKQQDTSQVNNPKTTGDTVYCTPAGKRYHRDPDCGGENSHPININDAVSRGLTPCQKCAQ